jgi:EamA domain-containing membrane protein RarD
MTVKPGYTTTEFLASLLASVGAWLAEWQGSLAPKWAAIVTSASFAAYAFSRAIVKHGVATSGKPIVTVPAVPVAPPVPAPPVQAV